MEDLKFPLKVDVVHDNNDGTVTIQLEYGDEFRDWFMEREGLKRWSDKRFEKVMGPLLEQYYTDQGSGSDDEDIDTPEET